MLRKLLFASMLMLCSLGAGYAFPTPKPSARPKLVVGIVIDQMRQEYLLRYYDKFGEDGFKRMMNQGFVVRNAQYNYVPTYTGPGHTSIYTGTTPATHGIIGNDWYDRKLKREIYCAEDTTVSAVGGSEGEGHVSPRNMIANTITDQLKLSTQKQAKVIGMSIKDRGAALPAGHMADAAYWYDGKTGEFMTSTFYMDELPDWVKQFNNKKLAKKYLSQTWNTLLPIESYVESSADNTPYENLLSGKKTAEFPYDLGKMLKADGNLGLLPATPFGNTILADFAKEAITAEQMGQDSITDFLAVSFSSTDYVGHAFGPESIELEDTYLRLDKELASLLQELDKKVGKGEYAVFLTADHAVVEVPQFLVDNRLPGGYINIGEIAEKLELELQAKYGNGTWIENASNEIFLNRDLIREKKLDLTTVQQFVADRLLTFDGIKETFTATDMQRNEYTRGRRMLLQMGYNFQRSGDVLFATQAGFLGSSSTKGTSHGSGYNYDTHVPMLFYGWGIPQGETVAYHEITDIAPTMAMLLNIMLPNASDGQPIQEILDAK